MIEARPDPDQLLEALAGETRRGALKIFFGANAGVGKTYAMLQAARQRQAEGVAVAIGVVETHGRDDTRRLIDGLPELPLKTIRYRDRTLTEFDLDGALAAPPQLLLIDELAHTNAPTSRHAKRWQDVDELLQAGIDVYTTLNVQHLESLSDIVGGIAGIRIRETVPDQFFDAAADVVLVDLPPDDLLARLQAGKVYLPATIQKASENFFRKGNLIALRELALRRVADRVNADVRSYRVHHAIEPAWPTRERLLVCVRADAAFESLIRDGSRLAQRLQADWIVVHVDEPQSRPDPARRECLRQLAKLAASLGAEFASVPGEDVARTLGDYGAARAITKFVLGRPRPGWRWPWAVPIADRLGRTAPAAGLVVLALPPAAIPTAAPRQTHAPKAGGRLLPFALATLACAITTLVAGQLIRVFDLSNVVMLFLLTVVFVSLRLGRAAGAWAALLSVASFDFFFVEPDFSFTVSDTQYLFTFALMLAVALATGQLAARLRYEAIAATGGERRATAVARVARDLSGAVKPEQIIAICTQTIAPLFRARATLVLPDRDDRLIAPRDADYVDTPVAQWSYDHVKPAGLGTQTLSAATAFYLPLRAPIRTRGVLVLRPESGVLSAEPDDRRLLEACTSLIALALERIHFVEVAQETLLRMEGERLRNALLAAISHDLRTPLTAIRGLAEILEQGSELPETERLSTARAIRVQAEELHRLVTNLLDLARLQSDGMRLNKEWHALGEIVGSALARMGPLLARHRIETHLPEDLPLVELDAVLFERVLVNLLDNAAKYTPPGATISIAARPAGNTMHILVEDDGPGLPVTDTDELFEPFTRGVRESAITGVGLGLALCRSIVAAHGGTIAIIRDRPRGAGFDIALPLGQPPEIEAERPA